MQFRNIGSHIKEHYTSLLTKLYGTNFNETMIPSNSSERHEVYGIFNKNECLALVTLYYYPEELRIGNIEFIENFNVAECLVNQIKFLAQQNAYKVVLAPINDNTWNNYRWSKASHFPQFFTETLQKAYYLDYFYELGFHVCEKYFSRLDNQLQGFDKTLIIKLKLQLSEKNVNVRQIQLEIFDSEIAKIHQLSLDLFKRNPYFYPISFNKFLEKYYPLKSILNPELIYLAENENNELLGYVFALDNLYDKNGIIIKTIANTFGKQTLGLTKVLTQKIIDYCQLNNKKYIIHAFMRSDNASLNISKKYGGTIIREYHLLKLLL